MPILSRNADQKSIETVFWIAICRPTGDKCQSKTPLLSILIGVRRLLITFSIAAYPVCYKHVYILLQYILERNDKDSMQQFMESRLLEGSIQKIDKSRTDDLDYVANFVIEMAARETITPGTYSGTVFTSRLLKIIVLKLE